MSPYLVIRNKTLLKKKEIEEVGGNISNKLKLFKILEILLLLILLKMYTQLTHVPSTISTILRTSLPTIQQLKVAPSY